MIKYIGSKRLLVPLILETVKRICPTGTVVDLFSGTSRVGHALKRAGYRVLANDHNAYAHTLGMCYVQSDLEDHRERAAQILEELAVLPGRPGYFTETFCVNSRFFHPKNGERIDAIRDRIEDLCLEPEIKSILLVALMEAADRVDSTTGVQMAYLKKWAPRAHNDLELRVPDVLPRASSGKGSAHKLDALRAAEELLGDVCYIDPPYNQHKYLGNYHVWESLVLWDKPEVYGVACKRVDVRERSSVFNSKPKSGPAMRALIRAVSCPTLVVSFNNEGFHSRADVEDMLAERGEVVVVERDFKRYVGAQIGIHNPSGERVGKVSHLRNKELLYVATQDASLAQTLRLELANYSDHAGQRGLWTGNSSADPDEEVGRRTRPGVAEEERAQGQQSTTHAVVNFLDEHGASKLRTIADSLDVNDKQVREVIAELVRKGVVSSEGRTRATTYRLIASDATSTGAQDGESRQQKPGQLSLI